MKKVILSFCVLLSVNLQHIVAQDIFKQHGFTKKPLTLSNGVFNEFFNNDEIVQIGSVLLNTVTNKIVAFIVTDTTGLFHHAEHSSRWLSPDPLAAKYPNLSPYNYALNNPIIFVDPDGQDVVYFDENGKEISRITSDERFESYYRVADNTKGSVNCELSPVPGSFMQAQMPGVVAGFEDPQYQQLDYQIAASTGIMNDKLESKTDLPATDNHQFTENSETPTLDVNLVKSIVMTESKMGNDKGGNGTAASDPMQSNYPGDWKSSSDVKTAVGLTKNQAMTPQTSINAGLGILVIKGMNSDAKGNYTTWKGDKVAVTKYNSRASYATTVFKYFNSIQPATKSNYVSQ